MRASYTYGNKRSARSVSASLRARYFSPLANNNCAWMVACLVRTCRRSASRNSPFVSRGSLSSKILRVAISTRPMTAPAASSAASLGTSAGRGSSILVCSLSVSFAANAAGAIAAVRKGQNPQDAGNENLAIAHLPCFPSPHDGLLHLIDQLVFYGNFDAGLRHKA